MTLRSVSYWQALIDWLRAYPGSARHHLEPIPLEARLRDVRAAMDARDTRRAHYAIAAAKRARTAALARELGREFMVQ